jgi:hypothetical protein
VSRLRSVRLALATDRLTRSTPAPFRPRGYPIDTPHSIWKTRRYRSGKAVDVPAHRSKCRRVNDGDEGLLSSVGGRDGAEALNRFLSLREGGLKAAACVPDSS